MEKRFNIGLIIILVPLKYDLVMFDPFKYKISILTVLNIKIEQFETLKLTIVRLLMEDWCGNFIFPRGYIYKSI